MDLLICHVFACVCFETRSQYIALLAWNTLYRPRIGFEFMGLCLPLLLKYLFVKCISKIYNKSLKICENKRNLKSLRFIISVRCFHFFCLELAFNLHVSKHFFFFLKALSYACVLPFIFHILCLLFLVVYPVQHSAFHSRCLV